MKMTQSTKSRSVTRSLVSSVALLALMQGCATNTSNSSAGGNSAKPSTDGSEYGMSVATSETGTSAPSTSADSKPEDQTATQTKKQVAVAETKETKVIEPVEPAPKQVKQPAQTTKTKVTKKKESAAPQKKAEVKVETKKAPVAAKTQEKTDKKAAIAADAATKSSAKVEEKAATAKSEEVKVALAEPGTSESNLSVVEDAVSGDSGEFSITAADLPYRFGTWTLERNWDNQHPDTCRLVSSNLKINDGYDMTNFQAEVRKDEINIYTGSNIDLTYENSGIQIDALSLVPYSNLIGDSSATVKGDFTGMLANAGELRVSVGFWPTWPKTETQQLVLPLEEMRVAIPALLNCNNL
ncbi:hypothetical protein [Hahella ganghwensis]|uniref:hypothetical protein n=1 Tax=Hahella ganghwensis TaxID=286420 RepID=UPI00037E9D2E|nr:hypothetical protein [Hahella ganghwensis]